MNAIAAKPRKWTFEPPARLGFTTVFTQVCPAFCESVHREGATEFPGDVWHQRIGSPVELTLIEGLEQAEPYWVLQPSISTRPYALEPEERVPHVKVEFDEHAERVREVGRRDRAKHRHGRVHRQAIVEAAFKHGEHVAFLLGRVELGHLGGAWETALLCLSQDLVDLGGEGPTHHDGAGCVEGLSGGAHQATAFTAGACWARHRLVRVRTTDSVPIIGGSASAAASRGLSTPSTAEERNWQGLGAFAITHLPWQRD